jgi:hypothetical protein
MLASARILGGHEGLTRFQPCNAGSGGCHCQGTGTGKDYDGHQYSEREPVAPTNATTTGGSVQLPREQLPLGRMFVRMCAYVPFSARLCLNQHHWFANRMCEENIDFGRSSNAFLKCGNFERLQELADSLTARDLPTCGQKWLAVFTPFFQATGT